MKKLFFLLAILAINTSECMYHGSKKKLPHTDIKVTNKASIPMKLVWVEVDKGNPKDIEKIIEPNNTISIKLGEIGDYNPQYGGAKVIYNPIPTNEKFKQEFRLDLPSSNEWVFTAVKLADILNNVFIPGVLKADEKGNFSSFQYKNLDRFKWDSVMEATSQPKTIENP